MTADCVTPLNNFGSVVVNQSGTITMNGNVDVYLSIGGGYAGRDSACDGCSEHADAGTEITWSGSCWPGNDDGNDRKSVVSGYSLEPRAPRIPTQPPALTFPNAGTGNMPAD